MDPQLKEFVEKQREIVIMSYEQARSYSNIIMMGGYAGLFAVWGFTKSELSAWQVALVGILTLVSILLFVLFETYNTWLRATQTFKLMETLDKAEQMNKFPEDYGKQEQERVKTLARAWPVFFYSALTSGLAAAAILSWSFIQQLLNEWLSAL